jgi:hypothetical protein
MTEQTSATPAALSTPAEAASRLGELKENTEWTGKLMAGDPAVKAEWHGLHGLAAKGDNVDMAMAGVLQPGIIQSSDHLQMIGLAEFLRERGMPEDVVKEYLSGKVATTKEFHNRVAEWKREAMSDKDWSARLMSGDSKALKQFQIAHQILTSTILPESKT